MQLKAAVARPSYSLLHTTLLATPVSTVWLHLEESLVRVLVLVLPGQEMWSHCTEYRVSLAVWLG